MGQFRAARFALCEPHISLFRAEVSAPFFALQFDGKSKFLQDGSPGLTREQDKFVSENASFGQNLGAQGRFFSYLFCYDAFCRALLPSKGLGSGGNANTWQMTGLQKSFFKKVEKSAEKSLARTSLEGGHINTAHYRRTRVL